MEDDRNESHRDMVIILDENILSGNSHLTGFYADQNRERSSRRHSSISISVIPKTFVIPSNARDLQSSGFSTCSISLSRNARMAFDLASQQSKIPFAIQRKRETGLPSFGEKLKKEREKRKITLEQISVSTKIGTRMLQALEEDKFNQLPGGIFNKGFVRAYSRFVGLDEDQTVADYLQASGDAPPVSTEIASHEDTAREKAENTAHLQASTDGPPRQIPWGLLAATLLVIALALYLWSHYRREHARQSVSTMPTATASSSTTQSSSEMPGKVTSQDSRAGSPTAGSTTTGSTIASSASSVTAKPPQNVSASTRAAVAGEFTVGIQAREESWVSITVDGKTVSSELLETGSERSANGRNEIIVKIGNAGGVDLKFNGKKLDTVGEFGEVKTVTFGPHGILPNAPTPASTP
jgi:cytoskeleton protein RodZ